VFAYWTIAFSAPRELRRPIVSVRTGRTGSTFVSEGDFCYGHLADRGIYGEDGEYERTRKFVERLKARGEWPNE
jgi:hypothetical protein